MDTNILLESGTNELEVLEFTLGNNQCCKDQRDIDVSAGYTSTKFSSKCGRYFYAA